MSLDRDERILGALWGAVVGDALGVPVEFLSRDAVRQNPVTGMRGLGTHRQPAGTWSDDSSLLLCTVVSLTKCGGFAPADLASHFRGWYDRGELTARGAVFDIGIATAEAIRRLSRGISPEQAGGVDEYSNGNGSLMRIAPMALWFPEATPPEMACLTGRASALTHRHPRSQLACALYCFLLRELAAGTTPPEAWTVARRRFAEVFASPSDLAERRAFRQLEADGLEALLESEISASGYVLHTLTASIWCLLTSGSFEETVLKAVNLGLDTDTTGCVAGALAGACYGRRSIPVEWRKALAREMDLEVFFAEFLCAATGKKPATRES